MFALGVSAEAFRVKSRELTLRRAALARRCGRCWRSSATRVGGSWVLERRVRRRAPRCARRVRDAAYRLFGIGAPVALLAAALPRASVRIVTVVPALAAAARPHAAGRARARRAAARARTAAATAPRPAGWPSCCAQHGDSTVGGVRARRRHRLLLQPPTGAR